MEKIRIFISLPFRTDGNETLYPDAVFQFDVLLIRRYLEALRQEIESASYDMKGAQVTEIVFGIGSYCHMLTTDVEDLYRLICSRFQVSPRVRVQLQATATSFDFYRMTVARHLNMAQVRFDLPAADDEMLQKAGFRTNMAAVHAALNGCFQNAYHHLLFQISPLYHPTDDLLHGTLTQLLRYRPDGFSFFDAPSDRQLLLLRDVLLPAGYHEENGLFLRDTLPSNEPVDLQIGCGLNAVTQMDQVAFKTTSDLDFYCAHPTDFEALAHPLQENITNL